MKAMALFLVLVVAPACADSAMDLVMGESLPKCTAGVAPDHYCADGRVACWDSSTLPAIGASACTVSVGESSGAVERECVASCVPPGATLPPVTCEAGNVQWCGTIDADGLELAACGLSDCYTAYNYPPYVMHCVAVCP
jgi:hypothetical protein